MKVDYDELDNFILCFPALDKLRTDEIIEIMAVTNKDLVLDLLKEKKTVNKISDR